MKAKWGMMVVDGRGKLGGHVLSKNRSGAYARTKVTPVNPQTASQTAVRNRFGGFAQAWRGLTAVQRAAWIAAVDSFKTANVFGDLVPPSGSELYQRLNNNLSIIGKAAISTPPTPDTVEDIVIGALTSVAGVSLSLAYTAGSAGSTLKIFATPPVSAGKSYVKNLYRLISIAVESDTASPFDAYAAYNAVFGSNGAAGQKIYFKTVAVNATTGQEGVPQTAVAIST